MIFYDHIVIGVGSMGSAVCYQLSRRGQTVLGLEQFTIPHEQGSHSGETRIIRKAYYEHPDYIPLLIRAYENWHELMARSGKKLYHKTGLFYAAPKNNQLLRNIKQAAELYHIPIAENPAHAFRLPPGYETLFEPDAGFVEPENTIRTLVHHAIESGAEIHEREQVLGWRIESDQESLIASNDNNLSAGIQNRESQLANDGSNRFVVVKTNIAEYCCKKLIITAGAWSAKIIPGIAKQLRVTRQILAWVRPEKPEQFSKDKFPCWMVCNEQDQGIYYGFPIIPSHPGALKLAYHYPGEVVDADHVNREVSTNDTQVLMDFIKKFIPEGDGEIESTKVCLYSMTLDEHFVIDNLPGMEEQVCVAWGFSGHGFKFVPAVGEILADLAMYNKTAIPIEFLSARRFS